jgi:hypothetical protein
VLRLRKLVKSCGGKLYPDPGKRNGGRKFGEVVDILKTYYPAFVPGDLPLRSIDEDWQRDKKSRHPPVAR